MISYIRQKGKITLNVCLTYTNKNSRAVDMSLHPDVILMDIKQMEGTNCCVLPINLCAITEEQFCSRICVFVAVERI